MTKTDFAALIRLLSESGVEFILVGGIAGAMHGSAHATYDVDVVYRRTSENIARLAAALKPFEPCLRGAPAGLPFALDPTTIQRGLNFTLQTTLV